MIEQTAVLKAISTIVLKPLLAALIAFGWWPVADFVILQVDTHVLLTPYWKLFLEDSKLILGVGIAIGVLGKIIFGFVTYKKEK